MSTYAIVETSGTQLRVEPGRFYNLDRIHEPDSESREPIAEGSAVTFDRVLLLNNDGEVSVGQPYVEGVVVKGTVLTHYRDRKVLVYKMLPKKKTRKKRGHRQEITRLLVESIELNGNAIATAPDAGSTSEAPEPAPAAADSEE